jgi:hypothetical protein
MIGFLLVSPIPSSLTIDGAYHATRLFLILFPLVYYSAEGLIGIFKFKKLIGTLLTIALVFEFSYFQFYYWTSYKNESWRWWHYGYKQLMTYENKYEKQYNKILIENTYEPAFIRYLFWNKINPKLVFGFVDKTIPNSIDKYDGFCYEKNICFVNFNGKAKVENMNKNTLYVISHEKNVGGDWDWSNNPPDGIKVLETVRNPLNQPLFYLVTKT